MYAYLIFKIKLKEGLEINDSPWKMFVCCFKLHPYMEMFEFPSVWLCINEVLSYCKPPDAHKPGGIQKLPESHIVSLYWNDEVFNTWLDSRVTPLTIVKEWCLTHNSQLWGSGPRPSNRVILTATLPSGLPFRVPGPWSPEGFQGQRGNNWISIKFQIKRLL